MTRFVRIISFNMWAFWSIRRWHLKSQDVETGSIDNIEYDEFCSQFENELLQLRQIYSEIHIICLFLQPDQTTSKFRIKQPISRHDIRRESAFFFFFLYSLWPTSDYFIGESGIDAKGLTRDCFTQVAVVASNPVSNPDFAGNLFVTRFWLSRS